METASGETLRLSDLRDKSNVVLYFYPKAFTGGCTAQACSLQESYEAVRQNDAVVFGVSADDAATHQAFRERYDLDFPMIPDPDLSLTRLYEAVTLGGRVRLRITYVIDKAGVIRSAIRHDIRVSRHVPEVLAALAAIESR